MIRIITLLILSAILFSSCATNIVRMSVVEPAPVSIPPDVKHIGIVNRTTPSEENKGINKMDEILSIEGKELDKMIAGYTEKIFALAEEEFNIKSTKQLQFILFEKLNLKPSKKTKTVTHKHIN